jgi:hypothetical protein
MALQLTAMKGRAARGLARCMAWASNSLPLPLSPLMSTLASEAATILASASRSAITLERLTIWARQSSSPACAGPGGVGRARASLTLSSRALPSKGLVR